LAKMKIAGKVGQPGSTPFQAYVARRKWFG
jgi:hypothetical protein